MSWTQQVDAQVEPPKSSAVLCPCCWTRFKKSPKVLIDTSISIKRPDTRLLYVSTLSVCSGRYKTTTGIFQTTLISPVALFKYLNETRVCVKCNNFNLLTSRRSFLLLCIPLKTKNKYLLFGYTIPGQFNYWLRSFPPWVITKVTNTLDCFMTWCISGLWSGLR